MKFEKSSISTYLLERRWGKNSVLTKWRSGINFSLASLVYFHLFISSPILLSIMTMRFNAISVSWWISERYVHFCQLYRMCIADDWHNPWQPTEHLIYIAQSLFIPPESRNPVLPDHHFGKSETKSKQYSEKDIWKCIESDC